MHHKQYKINYNVFIHTFSYKKFHSALFLDFGFAGFVLSVAVMQLSYIPLFTAILCTCACIPVKPTFSFLCIFTCSLQLCVCCIYITVDLAI